MTRKRRERAIKPRLTDRSPEEGYLIRHGHLMNLAEAARYWADRLPEYCEPVACDVCATMSVRDQVHALIDQMGQDRLDGWLPVLQFYARYDSGEDIDASPETIVLKQEQQD